MKVHYSYGVCPFPQSIAACFVNEVTITFSTTFYYQKACARLVESFRDIYYEMNSNTSHWDMFPACHNLFSSMGSLMTSFNVIMILDSLGQCIQRVILISQVVFGRKARAFLAFPRSQLFLLKFWWELGDLVASTGEH